MRNDEPVQIMGFGSPGPVGGLLTEVLDAEGRYRAPLRPDGTQIAWSREDPKENIITAVFDTGVMHGHPVIAACLERSVDFTGEGTEDLNGHGSVVALQLCSLADDMLRLWSVKVVRGDGRGEPQAVIRAFDWLASSSKLCPDDRIVGNLSLGVYSRLYGLFECRGNCTVCQAAVKLCENSSIALVAAAGNEPGQTACPAKAGLLRKSKSILSVGSPGMGVGQLMLPGRMPLFVPFRH